MPERLLFIGKPNANAKTWTYLQEQGYELVQVVGLRPCLRALDAFEPALIIFDANDTSPINLYRLTHAAGRKPNAPFLVLLVNDQSSIPQDARHDAYLARPFTPRRLANLVRKLLDSRREYVVQLGSITLDRRTRLVRSPKGLYQLTPKQFALLDFLLRHPGELVTRRQLMREVWETTYLGDTRTLDVHIRWLRECVEIDPDHPHFIRTYRGRGYCLDMEGVLRVGAEPLVMLKSDRQTTPAKSA